MNRYCVGLITMHNQFEKGIMPYPGGLMDQPNKIIEAFDVINSYKQAKLVKEREQAKRDKRGR